MKGCVSGHNMKTIPEQTVDECKVLCDADPKCKAFEYGVEYGGEFRKPRECGLQSGDNDAGCDGFKYNMDLYIKKSILLATGYCNNGELLSNYDLLCM